MSNTEEKKMPNDIVKGKVKSVIQGSDDDQVLIHYMIL